MNGVRRVGVLGGMGPAATADFYRRLIAATGAATDQEHLPVAIWADPRTPDRTAALLDGGPDPRPWLASGTRWLVDAGCEVLAMPCNTAHAFLATVRAEAGDAYVVDMVEQTAAAVAARHPGARAAVMATPGTVRSGLYTRALGRRGLEPVVPDEGRQRLITAAIRAGKAGADPREAAAVLTPVLESLVAAGADVVVTACTELPLLHHHSGDWPLPVVDSTEVLATTTVELAQAGPPDRGETPCPRTTVPAPNR
ncbi:amino acid racemase [Streptomyces sp. SL13]|uniref:Amino acid racemase n=1 Tax=Streptantibioticus silvisoli TaxID=2705255 RepID=A0AA90GZ90_9ACTN|nr:amino acid racemase [Streptantibioticus silvisoli]MDI5971028.1 amino acid racemase [Streptantibioticus silvisoli]